MAGSLQQFIINPATKGTSSSPINPNASSPLWALSDESVKSVMRLIDADVLYLDKITRLLYSSTLVKTGMADNMSPLPGYSLQQIGNLKDHKPNINYEGYMTVANNFILFVSDVHSTTHISEKRHSPELSAVNDTMAIIDMLHANWEQWQFTNESLTIPLGLAIFEGIYFTRRRSMDGNMMNKVMRLFNQGQAQNQQEDKPKVKWLPI